MGASKSELMTKATSTQLYTTKPAGVGTICVRPARSVQGVATSDDVTLW